MYSIVLMVAVTASSDSPDFGRRNRGGNGCHGGGYASCHGGYHGGGYGGVGCYGGGYGGGYGCSGGMYHGGGYGGGFGCSGGIYHGGGFGGGYGCSGGMYHGSGFGGGYGCSGGGIYHGGHHGGYHGSYGSTYVPYASTTPTRTSSSTATLVVELPAEASLTIDGRPTTSTSSTRRFVTPPLESGSQYAYTLRATVMRDGEPVSVTREVNVRPGQETRVRLDLPSTSVATRE